MVTEDIAAYMTMFGQSVVVNGAEINAIFDDGFREALSEPGAESSMPRLTCRTSDVASAAHGQAVTVGASSFEVVGVEPDGTGVTVLMLERQ